MEVVEAFRIIWNMQCLIWLYICDFYVLSLTALGGIAKQNTQQHTYNIKQVTIIPQLSRFLGLIIAYNVELTVSVFASSRSHNAQMLSALRSRLGSY